MLNVKVRQPKVKLNQLRKEGKIPAIVYGRNFDSIPIFVDQKEFLSLFKNQGGGGLWDISIDNGDVFKALLQDYQKNFVKDNITHIDFYRIRMDEKMRKEIPLRFTGDAEAVKSGVGVLIKSRDYLHIECLPAQLVSEIIVFLNPLKNIHDHIKVKDISVNEGITVLDDLELIVASIAPQQVEKAEVTKEEEKQKIEELGLQPEEAVKTEDNSKKQKDK